MNAASYYGRGIDELREKKTAVGESDIAQAVKLKPAIADEFARRGLVP